MVENTLIDPVVRTVEELRVSPAQHLHELFAAAEVRGARGVRLRELQFLTMVGLRLGEDSPERLEVEARLGTPLPARCGQVARGRDLYVLWLSPDEYLVVSDALDPAALTEHLLGALSTSADAAIDLSANRTTFCLEGPSAREVLEKGCPVDLHPSAFLVNSAVSTNLGRVPVILWKTGEDAYRLLPRASFADFLGRWLVDAMAEFAVELTAESAAAGLS